jgi:hypothetical protein
MSLDVDNVDPVRRKNDLSYAESALLDATAVSPTVAINRTWYRTLPLPKTLSNRVSIAFSFVSAREARPPRGSGVCEVGLPDATFGRGLWRKQGTLAMTHAGLRSPSRTWRADRRKVLSTW